MKTYQKIAHQVLLGAALASAVTPTTAFAMPHWNKTLPEVYLAAVRNDPVIRNSEIRMDDKDPSSVYIGPARRKSQGGGFDYSGISANCQQLKASYELAYHLPSYDLNENLKTAKQGTFSPYFDFAYGNYVRNAGKLQKFADKIEEMDEFREKNKAVLGLVLEKRKLVEAADSQIVQLKSEIEAANQDLKMARENINNALDEDKEVLKEAYRNSQKELVIKQNALKEAYKQKTTALAESATAEGNARFATDREKELLRDAKAFKAIYLTLNEAAKNTFEAHLKNVEAEATKTVGRASAGFQLWGDEVARLGSILNGVNESQMSSAEFKVSSLPIANVRINQGTFLTTTVAVDPDGPKDKKGAVTETTKAADRTDPVESQAQTQEPEKAAFSDANGTPMPIQMRQPSATAGRFTTFISQGAYCMTKAEGEEQTVDAKLPSGEMGTSFQFKKYTPRSTPLVYQPVVMNYQYFVKTEPIGIKCTLDASRFASYMRSSGTSGFLFWKHSWDDTQRDVVENQGIKCEVTLAPTGMTEEALEQWKNKKLQQMGTEIMAEYVVHNAKTWQLKTNETVNVPKISPIDATPAFNSICGLSAECQIANIVWKSSDELFGNQSGSTSTKDNYQQTISRDYQESSYRLVDDSTVIEVTVQAPK